MESNQFDFDVVQPSMLRMIRSARSRLHRDASDSSKEVGSKAGVAASTSSLLASTTSRWRSDMKTGPRKSTSFVDQPSVDAPVKRSGTPRGSLLGPGGRQRLLRSRSSLDCSSENAPLEKPKAPTASVNVLGDVTNTSCAGQFLVQRPPTAPDAIYASKASLHEKGTTRFSSTAPLDDADCGEIDGVGLHAENPQHVAEYAQDIFRNLQRDEPMSLPSPNYMERQVHVNAKMRAILVDWLVDVHKKYKLRPETLFLAVSLIDRYLDVQVTAQRHLQLVGVTALLVAAKFEEVYPPQIKDFVYVTDKAYTREDILQMEVSMLRVLQFKICQPTAVNFLERYQLVNGCTDAHRDLAQYLLELTLVDYKMIKYSPSHLAAATILLSNKLLGRPAWTSAAVKHTRFTESMLRECAKEMCYNLEMAEQSQLQAVRKKFSQQKYHSVAKLSFMPTSADRATAATATSRRMSTGSRRSSNGVPMDIA